MSERFSQLDVDRINARNSKKPQVFNDPMAYLGKESDLHDQIEAELKRRRWHYVHSRTDRKTTQAKGCPDFIIAAPGRSIYQGGGFDTCLATTYWIEVKKKGGKLSPEQNVVRHVLTALGHNHAVVYSFQEFLDVIK